MNMNRISASIDSADVFCNPRAVTVTLLNAGFALKTYQSKLIILSFAFCKAAKAFLRIAKIEYAYRVGYVPAIFHGRRVKV